MARKPVATARLLNTVPATFAEFLARRLIVAWLKRELLDLAMAQDCVMLGPTKMRPVDEKARRLVDAARRDAVRELRGIVTRADRTAATRSLIRRPRQRVPRPRARPRIASRDGPSRSSDDPPLDRLKAALCGCLLVLVAAEAYVIVGVLR